MRHVVIYTPWGYADLVEVSDGIYHYELRPTKEFPKGLAIKTDISLDARPL